MLKKFYIAIASIVIGLSLVACSGGATVDKNPVEKTYEEEVESFLDNWIALMNAEKYDECFDSCSNAYIDVMSEKMNIGDIQLKSNYRKSWMNAKVSNFRLVSFNAAVSGEKYIIYSATIGYDYNNGENYNEYIICMFKEGDKIVFAEDYMLYKAIELAQEKYDYSSPVEGYSLPDGSDNDKEENQNTNGNTEENGTSEQIQSDNVRNEVPEKYEQAIEEFKYQSDGFIKLNTLNIKVGEFVTPMAASVWGNCTIYSQDTTIAKADGAIIEGISKGTVYVVVENPVGMTDVYMVIVE